MPTSGSDGVIGYATDNDGHGTHIAGMIGALDNNVGVVGVAPGARIHNLKIFGDDLTADVSVAIEAIEHAIDWKLAHPEKPGVMNLSFGENTWSTDYTSLDLVVETAISAGLIVVVAAGVLGVAPQATAATITLSSESSDSAVDFSELDGTLDFQLPAL